MLFLDQMKLLALIDLSLILILNSFSKGQSWKINVPQNINTGLGSTVIILCNFTYPEKYHTNDVQVYWKRPKRNSFEPHDNDKNQFVFHTNDTYVVEKYRGKTELIGNKNEGNCSLRIRNVMDNEQKLYVRLSAKGENYSFFKNPVSISVSGVALNLSQDGNSTFPPIPFTPMLTSYMYAAIFVPLSTLLLVAVVLAAVFFHMKCKRSQSLDREGSGYYANFSRASNDPAQREASCKNQENNKRSEFKIIDEPIYVNTEALTDQMDEDHIHNIYGNVDYS
ncbi:uncharacterized protein [Paralichthys olivaceus]|uniref:uncharacterized protein isoform X1 n=2 Tax=Paralichthys olivaceus TaxID=8255 RepID=UPI003750F082